MIVTEKAETYEAPIPEDARAAAVDALRLFADWARLRVPTLDGQPAGQHGASVQANALAFLFVELLREVKDADATGTEDEDAAEAFWQARAVSLAVGQFLAASCVDTEAAVTLMHAVANAAFSVCQHAQATMGAATDSPQGHEAGRA